MLPISLVQEIDRLVREGKLSRRQISLRVGASRAIISAIASGSRGLHGRESFHIRSKSIRTSAPRRCPECGYHVYMPCRICAMRSRRQREILLRILAADTKRMLLKMREGEALAEPSLGNAVAQQEPRSPAKTVHLRAS
jgi:hypothetical protein